MILNADGPWPAPAPEVKPQEREADLAEVIKELWACYEALVARIEYDNAKVRQGDIERGNDNARAEFLDRWLVDQIEKLRDEGLSRATIETYENDVKAFIRYIRELDEQNGKTPYPARDPQLATYLLEKLLDGAELGTLRRICAALKWANELKGAADPVQIYTRAVAKLAQQGGLGALQV
jgi:hypothetical protein